MGRCRRHPYHLVVGVCAYCLNEHLSAKLQDYEDPTSNFPSPIPFTLSNPAPLATRRVHMLNSRMIDDIASSSQFSVPLSPQCRLESSYYSTTSSSLSPQNQTCFGNPDFIKEEIPARKSKSSFWSFLHCGHHEFGLEDVRDEHIYDDDGIQVHGVCMPSMSQMRAQREKGRMDRHGLPRILFSSMPEFQAGSSCREVYVSLPHTALSPKQACRQRLSPSKQEYFHYPSSILYTIRRSPLRRERHGDEESFSEGLHGNHSWHAHNMGDYAYGSERHIDDREKSHGGSSSWKSWLFLQKARRSKSIPGLNGVGTYRASSDAEPTMARSVSVADQAYGSPRFSVSRSRNVPKGDNHRSPNMHMSMHAQGHSKSLESSFFHGYFGKGSSHASAYASDTNDANRPRDFLSFAGYAHSSPPSVKSPISSLPRCNPNLRFLEDSFTMLFDDDEFRRSPPTQAAVPTVAHDVQTKRAEHDHGNHDMHSYSSTSWSWSKALRKTLAKKQGDDPNSHHGTHEYNARKQISPLIHAYTDLHHHQHQRAHGSIKAPAELHVTESLALCSNGPPQHYSFLSRASYR